MRSLALKILLLGTVVFSNNQSLFAHKNKHNYYTPIQSLDSLMEQAPKPVVLLLTRPGCNFCIIEDHSIKKAIEKSKNDTSFYYVYFNALSKEPVTLGGVTYHFKESGVGSGVHELASVLTGQYLPTYPTILIWDKNNKLSYFREGLIHNSAIIKLVTLVQNGNGIVEF